MTDRLTVRTVVIGLVVIALVALICDTALTIGGHDHSTTGNVAVGALSALAAMLVSTRSSADPTVDSAIEQARQAGAAQTEAQIHELAAAAATEEEDTPR